MAARRHILPLLVVLLLLFPSAWAQSGTPSPTGTPGLPPTAELQKRLEEVESDLRVAPPPSPAATSERSTAPPSYHTSLLRIETSLRRMISLREADALLQTQIEQVDSESLALTQNGLEQERPYPVTLLDDLQYQLGLAEDELGSQQTSLASAKTDVKMQAAQLEERQALRRRILEQASGAKGVDLELERANENAGWAVKAMETALELANAEVSLAEKATLLAQKRRDLLVRKVELVKAHFQFTKAILDQQLNQLDAERADWAREHEEVQAEAASALEKVKALTGASDPAGLAQRDALTEWLTTYQRRKILLEQGLELNLIKKDLWERRFELSQGRAVTTLSDWEESTRGLVRRLESARQTFNDQLGQLRGRLAAVVQSAPENDGPVGEWKSSQAKALASHQGALEAALTESGKAYVLAQRLLSEIQATRKNLSWGEKAARGWAGLMGVWDIELYTIGDNAVTVGKVLVAFLVLLVGLTLTGPSTSFVSRRLLYHLPMADAARANIERGLRYLFILLVCLFALRVVNIPLTIFTFLGGTLAIAVGFGAQNILNNFISGLILMVERPIRVGDLIEVDQTAGVVEEIGARSTRIRLATGIHVVLPNSVLLENKVVNWTLTDQTVRTSVSVGVDYDSDPHLVMGLISRATLASETIEKTPEHFVMLEDFGDSALKFTVHFWVSLADPMNKRLSESNLRISIAALFRENGISIPFPRRDLTLSQPVAVQMVTEDTSKDEN